MHKKLQPGGYKYDDDEDYVPTKKVKYDSKDELEDVPAYVKKHTLDSDEEDEDEMVKAHKKQYDVLNDEDIDGQEDSTIDMDGETKITPFNMKEELQEGKFDKDGFYHFNKEDELKDAWLDNIDWVKIKNKGEDKKVYGSDEESDSDDDKLPSIPTQKEKESLIEIYEEIFPFLKEGESISKSLKRLSGNTKRLSSAERWKLKKQGKLDTSSGPTMEEFLKLTELVNKVINTGNMDIYQETYEMIKLKIQRFRAPSSSTSTEPSMDMFSDEVPSATVGTTVSTDAKKDSEADDAQKKDTFDEVKWEFRWENKDEAETHGPFTTEQMIKWKDTNYFKKGVYVRKTSEQTGPWYLSNRVDFDLYV